MSLKYASYTDVVKACLRRTSYIQLMVFALFGDGQQTVTAYVETDTFDK